MANMKCTSCSSNITAAENFVKFMCPECGEAEIIRCSRCKNAANRYKCPKCGFEGP